MLKIWLSVTWGRQFSYRYAGRPYKAFPLTTYLEEVFTGITPEGQTADVVEVPRFQTIARLASHRSRVVGGYPVVEIRWN